MIISPFLAFIGTPFTSTLTNSSAILHPWGGGARLIDDAAAAVVNHVFELVTVVLEEALHRPGGGIPERADRVSLDAVGNVEEQVQLLAARAAGQHPAQQAIHPARALAAGGALAAGLGHVEARDALENAHHAGGF